ncbi:MAG: PsiF family protein [Propionivibrio sp.]
MLKAVIAVVVFAFSVGHSLAAEKETKTPTPAQQAQRERMKTCNGDAKKQQLKGDDRKSFMSTCLKAEKS